MKIEEYTIANDELEIKFLNLGAIITEVNYKGKNRVLRFEDLSSYQNNVMYLGAIVGRTAGRIKDGKFAGGVLPRNYLGKHNLHGNNLNLRFYEVTITNDQAQLKYTDCEAEYPGELDITITFTLNENSLHQEIKCESTKPTLVNMTNHTYFNLNGSGSILDHSLEINASNVGILDNEMITIGLSDVTNTAFDFKAKRKISDAMKQGDDQFQISGFIDHPYLLKGNVVLYGDEIKMEIETNQPYLVAYLGSQIANEQNKLRNNHNQNYVGLCLETQKKPGDIDLITNYYSSTLFSFYNQ